MKLLFLIILSISSFVSLGQDVWVQGHFYHDKGNDISYCDSISLEIVQVKECNCAEVHKKVNEVFAPITQVEHTCIERVYTKHCKRSVWVSEIGEKQVYVWDGQQWVLLKKKGYYWHFYWENYTKKL